MSPQQQEWANHLEYVIFDEVHMIANSTDEETFLLSSAYVRILSLIKCPFLALSATIANPAQLTRWLCAVMAMKEKVQIYLAPEQPVRRWTDLHLHSFDPRTNQIVPLHPISLVRKADDVDQIAFLSPIESLELFEAMEKQLPMSEELKKLTPELFFNKKLRITRVEQSEYSKVLLSFYRSLPEAQQQRLAEVLTRNSMPSVAAAPTVDSTRALLDQLHKMWLSPSVVFHHDLQELEYLLDGVVSQLEVEQEKSGKKVPIHKEEQEDKEKPNAKQTEKMDSDEDDEDGHFRDMKSDIRQVQEQAIEKKIAGWLALAMEVHPDYSFLRFDAIRLKPLHSWLHRLFFKLRRWSYRHPLLRALARGLGLHDSNIPKPYR